MPRPQQAEPADFKYRPDIDGLRAIAVVPVVLYHFKIPYFIGGFVGVDVFFVISGFLITSLIDAEIRAGRFSIVNFYERRVRRILPPLIVVVAAAIAMSLLLLFPADLKRFAESVIAVAVFSSNVEFWREAGYFDSGAIYKPLLHTWSLAVEEQFYLFFPPTLMLLDRFFRRSIGLAVVALILVASLAISIATRNSHPDFDFYLPFSRMWELALGALLALGAVPVLRDRMLCTVLAAAGLLLILFSIFFVSAAGFPGYMALVPCLGTALILYAGMAQTTPVSAVLSAGPMVGVGLISYSFYLWHWPVFVFARYDRFTDIPVWQAVLWILLSAGLATLSWRFIERPIRRRTILKSRKQIFLAAFAGMALLAVAGVGIIAAHELPQRFPKDIQAILKAEHDYEPRRNICFDRKMSLVDKGDFCTIGTVHAGDPDFILWGDSHSDALLPAVEAVAERHGQYGLFAGRGACPPFPGVTAVSTRPRYCAEFADDVLKTIAARHIKTVILATRWSIYAEGTRVGTEGGGNLYLQDAQFKGQSLAGDGAVFNRAFPATVHMLLDKGLKVIIIGPVPEVSDVVPDALAKIKMLKADRHIEPSLTEFLARQRLPLAALDRLGAMPGVTVVYPQKILCGTDDCMVEKDGVPLYIDNNHLTTRGALLLTPLLDPLFATSHSGPH
ncbi:MAG TPA: acyltransferase family protein [Rhizomicrobium sp.]|jgi:peptidoglycan/LPS O-acetylase OafA/YrhL